MSSVSNLLNNCPLFYELPSSFPNGLSPLPFYPCLHHSYQASCHQTLVKRVTGNITNTNLSWAQKLTRPCSTRFAYFDRFQTQIDTGIRLFYSCLSHLEKEWMI